MTTPKVNTIKRGGSRFYVNPDSQEKYPGVTSVLKNIDKSFLTYWAAKMVAEEAVNNLDVLSEYMRRSPEAAIDMLKRAPQRNTKAAADTGTAAHDIFERMARGENVQAKYLHEDLQPFAYHFAEFLDTCQPEYLAMEETVWDDEHKYAGSFDALAKIDGQTIWLDNKTTRSGIHAEVGLQLAAYRYAKHILRPDGSRVPNKPGDGAAVLHIRPEGWHLTPVRADEEMFEMFLHLREVFEWDVLKNTVVSTPVASGPDGASLTSRKRAPRAKTGSTLR
ncbi:exonuclease [Microbacterium phage Mabodamaca]|uniref:Exonuclease n=1 Tax=Microbacterium phage Mabodamaca TaxID=3078574 RepID=A0AA96NEE0_9CAUD|nr:exonuclease [Microbacterium phage Mabodamaca]